MGVRADNIQRPIIEVKDKVNEGYKPEAPEVDKSTFVINTPIYINNFPFYGTYRIGQDTTMYESQEYETEEPYEVIERLLDEKGNLVLDEGGNPKVVTVRKTRMIQKTRKVKVIIDEKFKQMLLGRAAEAHTQEERIYKNEGIRIDQDEHGNLITTRHM